MGKPSDGTTGCETGTPRSTRPKSFAPVEQGEIIHAKPEVDTLQRWLISKGHTGVGKPDGSPDGQFGDKSGQAFHDEIERIQKANGIKPDGQLNKETMEALRQESPEVAEAVKRLQDDKIGSRPSAMDRIYNAKRYESKPEAPQADDNMCRVPGAAPKAAIPQQSISDQEFMRRIEEAMERGGAARGSPVGGREKLVIGAIDDSVPTYIDSADNAEGQASKHRGTLDTSGLAKLRDLGGDSPAVESPIASIGNAISSWANRLKSNFS